MAPARERVLQRLLREPWLDTSLTAKAMPSAAPLGHCSESPHSWPPQRSNVAGQLLDDLPWLPFFFFLLMPLPGLLLLLFWLLQLQEL